MHKKRFLKKIVRMETFILLIIIVYCIVVTAVNPAFFSVETLFDMLRSSSGTMLLALGVLLVIISGGIDVSFTAIAIIGGYCSVKIMLATGIDNIFFGLLTASFIGLMLGLINALIIHFFKLPTLIATLGTSSVYYGLMTTFVGTSAVNKSHLPKAIINFGALNLYKVTSDTGSTFGLSGFVIPVAIFLMFTWFVMYKTMLGRSIFALGSSEESAVRVGFNVLLTKLFIYGYMGFLSGIMGVMSIAEVNYANPISLVGTELMVIAAVVMGGTRLSGGEGTIFGAVVGVVLIYLFKSTLVFLGLSTSWNDLFIGIILLISVAATSYQARVRNRQNLIFTE